jgi:hypothetical protein
MQQSVIDISELCPENINVPRQRAIIMLPEERHSVNKNHIKGYQMLYKTNM